jgi:transcriptional regulator GlxA family with amidase domain
VEQSRNAGTLAFIRRHAASAPIVSVCTGCMILAASGILDGRAATTKREVVPPEVSPLHRLRREFPRIDAREASFVDADDVITGGGVTLCIDTMLHVLARFFGAEMAAETARSIEYHRAWAANQAQLPPLLAG